MEHNEFKDQLYEVLDENDVALGIEDIDTSDAANIFTIKTKLHYRHRTGTVQKGCRSLCRTV